MSRCFRNDLEGVYIVIGKTIEGNYKLTTADGEELKYSVPPYKLKPLTTEPENPSVEVERILNKRTNSNNENEYFVKWKGLEQSENEWVIEQNFDDRRIINDFNNGTKTFGRGRPRKGEV